MIYVILMLGMVNCSSVRLSNFSKITHLSTHSRNKLQLLSIFGCLYTSKSGSHGSIIPYVVPPTALTYVDSAVTYWMARSTF